MQQNGLLNIAEFMFEKVIHILKIFILKECRFLAPSHHTSTPFGNEIQIIGGFTLLNYHSIGWVFQIEAFTSQHVFTPVGNTFEQHAGLEQLDYFGDGFGFVFSYELKEVLFAELYELGIVSRAFDGACSCVGLTEKGQISEILSCY